MSRKEEFDWLDDPFNDKKSAQKMGGGSKAAVGIGCVAAVIIVIVLLVVLIGGALDVASVARTY